jgi:ribosomal protein S18 acetylase RimI-like enzyme
VSSVGQISAGLRRLRNDPSGMETAEQPVTDTPSWHIRPARAQDREFILSLTPRLAEGFPLPPWRTPEEVVRAEAGALASALDQPMEGSPLLLAERSDGELGGFVYVQRQVDYFRQQPHAHVSILTVGAEVEGQGAGRALLEAAEGWARMQGMDTITLHVFAGNQRARALYERLGYAPETLRYVKRL